MEINYIKEELGLSMVINPELAAAAEMSRLLKLPSAITVDTFTKGRVEVVKYRVGENSVLCDQSLQQIKSRLKSDIPTKASVCISPSCISRSLSVPSPCIMVAFGSKKGALGHEFFDYQIYFIPCIGVCCAFSVTSLSDRHSPVVVSPEIVSKSASAKFGISRLK